jgi:hypothetical protein
MHYFARVGKGGEAGRRERGFYRNAQKVRVIHMSPAWPRICTQYKQGTKYAVVTREKTYT